MDKWNNRIFSGNLEIICLPAKCKQDKSCTNYSHWPLSLASVVMFIKWKFCLRHLPTSGIDSGFFPNTSSLNAHSCSRALGCFECKRFNARTKIGSISDAILDLNKKKKRKCFGLLFWAGKFVQWTYIDQCSNLFLVSDWIRIEKEPIRN